MSGTCAWCGGAPHDGVWCPRIKAVEYHEDGETVRRVEVFEPAAVPAAPQVETDSSYRARLKLIGRASVHAVDIPKAKGAALDQIGEYLDTKRQGT